MSYDLLIQRINERLYALGMSERAATKEAGIGVNTIRHIRARGHAPKIENLYKLARVLNVRPEFLIEAAYGEKVEGDPETSLMSVVVKGEVDADQITDTCEWPSEKWYTITLPQDVRIKGKTAFGLVYHAPPRGVIEPKIEDGAILIFIDYDEFGRSPRSGDRILTRKLIKEPGEYSYSVKSLHVRREHVGFFPVDSTVRDPEVWVSHEQPWDMESQYDQPTGRSHYQWEILAMLTGVYQEISWVR